MIDTQVIEDAIKVYDNVIDIAKKEQLRRGHYISSDIVNDELYFGGAICGGHTACLIGSLYLGAGIRMKNIGYGEWDLPGVSQSLRRDFMKDRPALKLAYDVLNEEAREYAADHDIHLGMREGDGDCFTSAAEALFENGLANYTQQQITDHTIALVRQAKRRLKREYKVELKAARVIQERERELVAV